MITDVIDHLAGISPGSPLDRLRERRPDAREHAQRGFDALFTPDDDREVTLVERDAVAAFVTGLHHDAAVARFYADRLAELAPGLVKVIEAEIETGRTTGPYGIYPDGGVLAAESDEGLRYRTSGTSELGERLAAALEHAHLLVFRPREARQDDLDALARAGWSATGIVTLSQLVAFLSFQVRVISGLRLLNQEGLTA
ncbi:CMD domain protein, Avi_7170 family [Nonomuraea solani]|uniref:CMD domain protein, Avi_7170 family n=1 Tax=Nonomuraea solani TaxID=1144553 RepID=A0A1H6DST5_9ACTN|nr:CMD domain protein [Nonomuraea solani]SEG88298.1 CMD domain protein, Avi_7170 family [Nonomuraea solani]